MTAQALGKDRVPGDLEEGAPRKGRTAGPMVDGSEWEGHERELIGMETRKVQVTGKSTFVISLPKKWANKVGIMNGDNIVLIPLNDGTLLLNPKLTKRSEEATRRVISLNGGDPDELQRKFIGAYLAGYDLIEVRSGENISKERRQLVRQLSHKVIGPEIIDETNRSITVKDLLDASDFSIVKGVTRMYVIARSMHLDAMAALKDRDAGLAEDVEARDDEVDKLYWMISKQYNQVLKDVFFADKLGVTPQESLGHLLIARAIERIADHAVKIARNIKDTKDRKDVVAELMATSASVLQLLDDAMVAFQRGRFEASNDVLTRARALERNVAKLNQEIHGLRGDAPSIIALAYILDSLDRTLSYTQDIAEVSINHQFAVGEPQK